ncbi:hypothetical protein QUF90_21610 [Desulfococcaceae bacterium HSG9]|nr:hypothetical protein [Desulfococcaceae bacterium HSG9]
MGAYDFFSLLATDSSVTLVLSLVILMIIALYVNRKRDVSGKVSFIDQSKTGIIAVRIFEVIDGFRKRSWILPLWAPQKNLLCNVKIMLPNGEYELKACWRESRLHNSNASIFEAEPFDEQKTISLSDVVKFQAAVTQGVEFRLQASGKKIEIDSPDKKKLKFSSEKNVLPLTISKLPIANKIFISEKIQKKKIWELSLIDDRLVNSLRKKIGTMRHKLDGLIVKNRELESNLDQTVNRLRKNARSKKEKIKNI